MRNRHSPGLCAALLTLAGMTAGPVAAGDVTIGDFLRNVATAMRLPAGDAIVAEASLRAAGFPIPAVDRGAGLTEGAVATISTAVGLRIATSNPVATFDGQQVERFMTSMGSQLNAARPHDGEIRGQSRESSDSRSHSGGKKKPHSRSPKKPRHPSSHHHRHGDHGDDDGDHRGR